MTTNVWTVAATPHYDVARELRDRLTAQGFDVTVEHPRAEVGPLHHEIRVPIAQHYGAYVALRDSVPAGAYLTPPRVTYLRTTDPYRYVRITFSPAVACEVVSADIDRHAFAGTAALLPDTIAAARQTAEAAGLKLKTPNACLTREEWYQD